MTDKPLLSIIVPLYNTEKYIEQCLLSIVDSGMDDVEVIVVDDGSTDASASIVQALHEKYSQIRCINQSNQGVSQARTYGASVSKGEYLWFIDSDDYLIPKAVEHIIHLLHADPTDPAITADFIIEGKELLKMKFRIICPQQFIIRRDVFNREGVYFPQGIRYEDEYFSRVIQYEAKHVQVIKDYLYIYRQWPGSFMNSAKVASAKYLVEVYRHLSAFAKDHVSPADQAWFRYNIVSFLLETHTRFSSQIDTEEFHQFRKQYLPFIKQEFENNRHLFPRKERSLCSLLLKSPRCYFRIMSSFFVMKRWLRR